MSVSKTTQVVSQTFRQTTDSPLRSNDRDILQSNLDGNLFSAKLLFCQLEKAMSKEIRLFWDKSTLSEYVALERMPRSLRIKKFPTFELHDEEHKKKWTDTLSGCSIALMKSILSSKSKEIDKLQNEISIPQEDIKPLQNMANFTDLDTLLNDRFNKLEKDIIETKKEKMLRDKLDYDTDTVYM